MVVRFEHLKWMLFGNTNGAEINYPEFGYRPSNEIVSPEVIAANKENWEKRLAKNNVEILRKSETNYSKHYIRKIAKLANDNNCELLFLYLPESGSDLKTPMLENFYTQFGNLAILPPHVVEDQLNWKDATHFNNRGAKMASQFLLPHLESMLDLSDP